jgi:hypothetical protein
MKVQPWLLTLGCVALLASASSSQDSARIDQNRLLQDYYQESYGLVSDPGPLLFDGLLRQGLLAKARPDECFTDIGGFPISPPCPGGTEEKTNEAYVWGLTKAGDRLWFGTAPNVHCLVMGSYLGLTSPVETPSYVCEFGESFLAQSTGLPAEIGDFRPPHAYVYDLGAVEPDARLREVQIPDPLALATFQTTLGIRSAGSIDDIVFLAGPALLPPGSINVFAFDAETMAFIGHRNFIEYSNVRKWRAVGGQLYVGVGNSPVNPDRGGTVLRWLDDECDPLAFEVVGRLGSQVAELAEHKGRLFVTTWPDFSTGELASVYHSPVMPDRGLRSMHMDDWTNIWQADMYECSSVCAATYGGGAIASFGDYVYWGTMHVPGLSLRAWASVYGMPTDPLELAAATLGTYRNISIHRARFTDGPEAVRGMEHECVYGMNRLPVYSPASGWRLEENNSGAPLFGVSGFGNLFNNYTWTMEVYRGRLFVGTMDWSYLLLGDLLSEVALPREFELLGSRRFGADLWSFPDTRSPARALSIDGLGNETNYGIRTMLADRTALYLGTANPMNLHSEGGWELWRLQASRPRLVD